MKTGSKYYGFKNWNENRVKIFREKEPENLGMKTWILISYLIYIVYLQVLSTHLETKYIPFGLRQLFSNLGIWLKDSPRTLATASRKPSFLAKLFKI